MARVGKYLFTTMMATIMLLAFSLNVSASDNLQEVAVKVSAYTLKECRHNQGKTASGKQVKEGYIAISRDLERKYGLKFGDKVFISGIGEFEIQDRMNIRIKNCVDIYMTSYEKAIEFGVRKSTISITKQL
jgi:3D (Asp-Asp-Asp) domain-containing protein